MPDDAESGVRQAKEAAQQFLKKPPRVESAPTGWPLAVLSEEVVHPG
jgi:hypothetical protein